MLSTPFLPILDRSTSRRLMKRQEASRRAALATNTAIRRLTALGGWSKEGKARPAWREAGKRDQEEAKRLESEALEFGRREREGRTAAGAAGGSAGAASVFTRLVSGSTVLSGASTMLVGLSPSGLGFMVRSRVERNS